MHFCHFRYIPAIYLLYLIIPTFVFTSIADDVGGRDRDGSLSRIQAEYNQEPVNSIDHESATVPLARRRGNCVDSCALEYLSRTGRFVSDSEYDDALEKLGLENSVVFRSLEQCLDILNFFGADIVAIPFTADKNASYPSIGIIFIPPEKAGRIGHVIVVEDSSDAQLEVWDPSSRAPSRIMHRDQVKYPMETVFLVPRTYARSYYAIVFCATLFVTLFVLFFPSALRRIRSGLQPRTVTTIVVLCASLNGCGKITSNEASTHAALVEITPLLYDFGCLEPIDRDEYATKSFTVYNRGATPIECRVHPDCSCIVAEHGASPINVPAGDKREFQLKVSLRQKVGSFEQNVSVSVTRASDNETLKSQSLDGQNGLSRFHIRLNGFVQRQPLPLRSVFHFRGLDGQTSLGVVQITHARKADLSPLTLVSTRVVSSPFAPSPPANNLGLLRPTEANVISHNKSDTGAVFFETGEPQFTAGRVAGGYCIDEWDIPVRFKLNRNDLSSDKRFVKSTLLVKWSGGQGKMDDTLCELLGELMRPIEMPSRFLVGNGVVGTELEAAVPVRINAPAEADKVKFKHPSQVRLRLDVASRRMMIWVVEEKVGDFNYRVLVTLNGDEVACISLLGRMSAKR